MEGEIKTQNIDIKAPKIEIPNVDISTSKNENGIKVPNLHIDMPKVEIQTNSIINSEEINVNAPTIEGKLKAPKIDTNLEINKSKLDIKGQVEDISKKKKDEIPEIAPLNIKTILSGKVDEPIILNKQNLLIPDVTVGVKIPKGKGKFEINIPNIDIKGPKIDIPNINIDVPKVEGNIKIPDINIKAPTIKSNIDVSTKDISAPKIEEDIKIPNIDIEESKISGQTDIEVNEIKIEKEISFIESSPKKLDIPIDINIPKLKDKQINNPKIEGEIKIPGINISQKENEISNPPSDIPLNLNSLMKGKTTKPIILNKRILHFPGLHYNTKVENTIKEVSKPLIKINSSEISNQKTIKKEIKISSDKSNKEIKKIEIIKTSYTVSLDNKDNSQISSTEPKLQTLNDIIESKSPSTENNLNISKTSSTKTKIVKSTIKITDPKRPSKTTIAPLSERKDSGANKSLRGSKKFESGRLSKKLSKAEINNLNVSGNLGKSNTKNRPSLVNVKPKEVKLPAKLIKMKDMISLKYNEPIHDVKEIPRFDIYKPNK